MIEEESSERMFRIILLSNQKKNKSVSCFSCLQTYYTRSDSLCSKKSIEGNSSVDGWLFYISSIVLYDEN